MIFIDQSALQQPGIISSQVLFVEGRLTRSEYTPPSGISDLSRFDYYLGFIVPQSLRYFAFQYFDFAPEMLRAH